MRTLFAFSIAVLFCLFLSAADLDVKTMRLPEGGVQPQLVVDAQGVIHVVYLAGEAPKSDVYYIRSTDHGRSFSQPLRVNSQPGSAIASGSIRGAQIAVGRNGRVHVAWNGSSVALPKGPLNPEMAAGSPYNGTPMLYARLGDNGKFEPQRNLMTKTFGLDGGGSVAADSAGNVYVAWHGKAPGAANAEDGRRVWLARSTDDGKSFSIESPISAEGTGACGCCGMRLHVDEAGELFALYRSAHEIVHRDIYLLHSRDHGKSFSSEMLHPWEIGACPMSSMSFSEGPAGFLAAWETQKQIYFSKLSSSSYNPRKPTAAPLLAAAPAENRKYPLTVQNQRSETLLLWTVASSWGKPGKLAWRIFTAGGQPTQTTGALPEIPAWSFAAAFARPDGGFTILY